MFNHIIAYYEWQAFLCAWSDTKTYGTFMNYANVYRRKQFLAISNLLKDGE